MKNIYLPVYHQIREAVGNRIRLGFSILKPIPPTPPYPYFDQCVLIKLDLIMVDGSCGNISDHTEGVPANNLCMI